MASDDRNLPPDPTPVVGAPTDIAPLSRSGQKPAHELTSDEDADHVDWNAIASAPEFKALLKAKSRFILPATIFFVVYYFALPVLVGFCPDFMKTKIGPANIAYLFALSQFFMAWIIAILYTRTASKWDRQSAELLAKMTKR
jgi:uncharacterized membrane protein (DUF485 family)